MMILPAQRSTCCAHHGCGSDLRGDHPSELAACPAQERRPASGSHAASYAGALHKALYLFSDSAPAARPPDRPRRAARAHHIGDAGNPASGQSFILRRKRRAAARCGQSSPYEPAERLEDTVAASIGDAKHEPRLHEAIELRNPQPASGPRQGHSARFRLQLEGQLRSVAYLHLVASSQSNLTCFSSSAAVKGFVRRGQSRIAPGSAQSP
jgi:hypothetical protein